MHVRTPTRDVTSVQWLQELSVKVHVRCRIQTCRIAILILAFNLVDVGIVGEQWRCQDFRLQGHEGGPGYFLVGPPLSTTGILSGPLALVPLKN